MSCFGLVRSFYTVFTVFYLSVVFFLYYEIKHFLIFYEPIFFEVAVALIPACGYLAFAKSEPKLLNFAQNVLPSLLSVTDPRVRVPQGNGSLLCIFNYYNNR